MHCMHAGSSWHIYIYLKGEQKYEEMIQVADHIHQYVPSHFSTETVPIPNSEETVNIAKDTFDPVLFGM